MSDDDEVQDAGAAEIGSYVDSLADPEEQLPAIVAIQKVMGALLYLRKSGEFKQDGVTKYRFRGVDAVMNAVGPLLRKYGLVPVPMALEHKVEHPTTSTGKVMANVCVKMQYTLMTPLPGDTPVVGSAWGEGFDSGDKATAKAESVAYRVFWLQLLCLPTDDPDPDSENYERGAPTPPARARQQQSGRQRPAKQQTAPTSDNVTEGQAKTLKDAIARIEPVHYRQAVLLAFKTEFGIQKAADLPKSRYAEASRWIHEHSTPPDDFEGAGTGDEPSGASGGAEGAQEGGEAPDSDATVAEIRAWLEEHKDRRFIQTQLAQSGKPATGTTADLLDSLAAETARRHHGIPAEWQS